MPAAAAGLENWAKKLAGKSIAVKASPRIGSVYESRFVVETKHLIPFADAEMPAVLSTPALIGELERTAREAVADLLEPHERTVGVEVQVLHLAPSLPGFTVVCRARVLRVEQDEITYQVEASDEQDLLARGLHRRRVVDVRRLRRRVEKKQRPTGPAG